jgi:DNA-binding NtrC family response regulator
LSAHFGVALVESAAGEKARFAAHRRRSMTGLVLVVDDRREVRELLTEELEEVGLRVVQAADGLQGWACYRRVEPDLVVTDLRMPRSDGIDLLRRIREVASTPVIVLTAQGDVATSFLALSSGAEEFMTFPDDLGRLIDRGRSLAHRGTLELAPADWLAGSSSRIRRVREQLARLTPGSAPVLVTGECDRGRVAAVAELRAHGPWASAPMLHIDASDVTPGPLPEAGFVHLEGVERLSPGEQRCWLGALRNPAQPPGAPLLRVVASTRTDRDSLTRAFGLDPELVACLAHDVIEVPPLRDRSDDLRELVPALVRRLARIGGLHDARVPAPVVTALRAHAWPGNLDQLVHVLRHAVRRAQSGTIVLEDVESALCDPETGGGSLRDVRLRLQRDDLATLFEDCRGNLAEMARRLGVSRGSVVYRLQKLGLPVRPGAA